MDDPFDSEEDELNDKFELQIQFCQPTDQYEEWVVEDSDWIAPFKSKTNNMNADFLCPAP